MLSHRQRIGYRNAFFSVAVILDIALVIVGDNSYIGKAFAVLPAWVVAWIALWFGWQVLLAKMEK